MKNLISAAIAYVGATALYIVAIGMVPGWAYWMWMSLQVGSFAMFLFGILGPLAFVAGVFGLWSLVFGAPDWLISLVT
jgi:hypothetical protein